MAGTIFALDLGTRLGWAFGPVGAVPLSGTVVLRRSDELAAMALYNLEHFLVRRWKETRPALVVKERQLPLQAFRNLGSSQQNVFYQAKLHGIVEKLCCGLAIRCEDVADATVRKHFFGRARLDSRAATKLAVVDRCHALGYMPKGCKDDNRADTLATWDWAAHSFGRASGGKLVLFREVAA